MQDKREKRFLLFGTCTETPRALTELSQPFIAILISQSSLSFFSAKLFRLHSIFSVLHVTKKNNSYLKVSPENSMASRVREQIHNSKITILSQFNNWTTCSGFLSAYRSQYHTQEGEVALQSGWSFKHRISMTYRMLLYFSLLLCIKTTCAASGLPSYWKFLFQSVLSKAAWPDVAGEVWKRNNLKFFRLEERFQKAPFSSPTSVDGPTVEINLRFQILRRCVDTASGVAWNVSKCSYPWFFI